MMFAAAMAPRVFGLPPGADFPKLLAQGILARLQGKGPEACARVMVLVNSARMRNRLREELIGHGPGLLPRIRLVSDPLIFSDVAAAPPPVPPLRLRLELAQLVEKLLHAAPDLAPRSAIFDLADSLAMLFSEMQAEGVSVETLRALDVRNHSGHWQRALQFIDLAQAILDDDASDAEGRRRVQALGLIDSWRRAPHPDPILIAGSTGSRGTTALLMQAVARLPQGALVLPGFDFDMPPGLWARLEDSLGSEDHPQYRYRRLMQMLALEPSDIQPWIDGAAPNAPRNRLVSMALRPAPVTDQWMIEGPKLADLAPACTDMTLIEAPGPRTEAQAIALVIRNALEQGQTAAVITPDRQLTRMITAALDRWHILPDDSAGRPLALTAPGRFLRHVAQVMARRLDTLGLMVLLNHPLTHSAGDRGPHLLNTRNLELELRKNARAFPDAAWLRAWGARQGCPDWTDWLAELLPFADTVEAAPLPLLVAQHIALAQRLAAGVAPEHPEASGELWQAAAGREALAAMTELAKEAVHGGRLTPQDYDPFVTAILQRREVREPVASDPRVMIWGTLEARVQGADLVILAGLNDGVWPKSPDPDPWLNRRMRADAGLLLPERQIGLSAHDFQQAIAAPNVVLTRALRDEQAQTVPSRWINRLVNLLTGLPDQGGTQALQDMRRRGQHWLYLVAALENDFSHLPHDPPAPRPAPAPPLPARPDELPVTAISRLIRDPYAIYARHVLRLRPLDPLHPTPDALLRGTVLHKVLEDFTKAAAEPDPRAQLLRIADDVLTNVVPWPAARLLWAARLARVADMFLEFHMAQPGRIALRETPGALDFPALGFRLTAKPDRIDIWPDGRAHVIDYKTGAPPSEKQQRAFDKQLLLQAVMIQQGGFPDIGALPVARATFLGLGATPRIVSMELSAELNAQTRAEFETLLHAYADPAQGYAARRMLFKERDSSDYDHLSRHGEWSLQDIPVTLPVGDHDAV